VFIDLVRRPLFAALALAGALQAARCAEKRGGSIPNENPHAAPDQHNLQTLPQDNNISPLDKN
jgi:hypothetical protein